MKARVVITNVGGSGQDFSRGINLPALFPGLQLKLDVNFAIMWVIVRAERCSWREKTSVGDMDEDFIEVCADMAEVEWFDKEASQEDFEKDVRWQTPPY